ncbi:SH3 domain-binding protein 1 isoform X2 [Lepisosteus oculatus]|uniref:SH3 domain-binding protein 1 isoform X2 n=1 Tax=Lepisosteus oculatus TaxID=7918 RepID=UPI0035F52DE2
MLKQLNRMKQFTTGGKAQDATDLLAEDLVLVEQRVEPAKKAFQILSKKLTGCLQSQLGPDMDKRMKKIPLMMLSVSMAESLKDFDGDSSIRRVLEMCCFTENRLARMLADFEVQMEKEVLEPLNKLSEEDLPAILRNKKQFAKLTTDWNTARNRQTQGSSGAQAKQEGLREEVEDAWRKLEIIKDQYSADLYHFATKEDDYASYFTRLLELQAEYHKQSFSILEPMISELKENNHHTVPSMSSGRAKVYGEPLQSHLQSSSREIALPVQECVRLLLLTGMKEEGLFRLAAAASVVKKLKSSLDSGNADHSEFCTDPHAVAGALKSYLRELPQPLMTFELYSDWFEAAGEKNVSVRLDRLREVCGRLPPENYNNLRYLVKFLAKLAEHQEVNKMTPSNIAIVLGPNLLWPRSEGEDSLLDMASASSVQVVTVIEPLIQFAHDLFPGEVDFETQGPQGAPEPQHPKTETESVEIPLTPPGSPTPSRSSQESAPVPQQGGSEPVVLKLGSVSRRTSMWENPAPAPTAPLSSDPPSQNPAQSHSGTQAPRRPSRETSPPEPSPTLPQGGPGVGTKPQKAKRSFQQRPAITHGKGTGPPSNVPQYPSTAPARPQAQFPPLAQTTAPEPRLQPALQSQAPGTKKATNRRGNVRAPNFPPPQPPGGTQVSSEAR